MLMLAAALIAAQEAPRPPRAQVMPDRQAQAMVRIVSAAVVQFYASRIVSRGSAAQSRRTELRFADGSSQSVKLLEFP